MINQETKQKILDALRVEEVVGDFVSLKRRGANLLGICPFHQEKTPSFIVSPAKGLYKCFGCGKGGDAVSFIMEHEHFSYPEALRYLANKYNILIEEKPLSPEETFKINERDTLLRLNDFAAKFFADILWNNEQGKAVGLSYFRERGFLDTTIKNFQLGYSPDSWNRFTQAAIEAGFKQEYLETIGLSIAKEEKVYDRFRARVMFPIHNLSGRVLGFGGRILQSDQSKAKYVNSPESTVYNKSQVLYGMFFAKKSILLKDLCYLVEGYTDVISLAQAGIENVVASSGTSLTHEQIALISRFTKNITILYDGDMAGIKASFRGIDMILEKALNVRVILFPDGADPDSFAKSRTSEEVDNYLQSQAKDFISFKTDILLKEAGNDPIKRAELIQNILESIALVPDNIYRSVYIQECSRLLSISEQELISKLNKIFRQKFKKENNIEVPVQASIKQEAQQEEVHESYSYQEKEILRLMLNFGKVEIPIAEDENKKIAEHIIDELSADDLNFSEGIFSIIYQLFVHFYQKGEIPEISYFLHHENKEIQTLSVDLCSSFYQLSPKWEDKGIYIHTEDDLLKLRDNVLEAIMVFKYKKLDEMIKDLDAKLKQTEDYIEMIKFMHQKKDLVEIRKKISEQLGRVIL